MHNYSLRQFGRTLLTIAGIILLVIFGSRAASQANSVTAVGGQGKHSVYPIVLTAPQLVSLASANAEHTATSSYEVAILDSTSGNEALNRTNVDGNGVVKAAGRIKQTASQLVDETVGKVTDAAQATKLDETNPQQNLLQTGVK